MSKSGVFAADCFSILPVIVQMICDRRLAVVHGDRLTRVSLACFWGHWFAQKKRESSMENRN